MNDEVCAKLTFNVNAFNGNANTTKPKPNALPLPVQPRQEVPVIPFSKLSVGLVRPL
jgi:hypothetical protein